jgi:hypothetical protein
VIRPVEAEGVLGRASPSSVLGGNLQRQPGIIAEELALLMGNGCDQHGHVTGDEKILLNESVGGFGLQCGIGRYEITQEFAFPASAYLTSEVFAVHNQGRTGSGLADHCDVVLGNRPVRGQQPDIAKEAVLVADRHADPLDSQPDSRARGELEYIGRLLGPSRPDVVRELSRDAALHD